MVDQVRLLSGALCWLRYRDKDFFFWCWLERLEDVLLLQKMSFPFGAWEVGSSMQTLC